MIELGWLLGVYFTLRGVCVALNVLCVGCYGCRYG